ERDGNVGGTVAGAVVGGLVGNQIGGGKGRKLATVAGAAAGGVIGNRIDRNHVGGKVVERVERQCRTVQDSSQSSRTVAWNVTYRNPDGTTGTMRTADKPGERIARSEEHTSELQSRENLVCRLLLEKKNYSPETRRGTQV